MRVSKFQCGLAASLFLAFLLSVEAVLAQNQVIITPSPGNLDGNSFLIPFNTSQSGRFQQVYDASLFNSLPAGGGSVFAILFRVDPFLGQSFSAGISNLQINLSTTTRGVDGLSSSFDQNTGANDTVVLGPGRVGDWLQAEAEVAGHDEHVAQVRGRLYGPRRDVLAALGSFSLLSRQRPPTTRS